MKQITRRDFFAKSKSSAAGIALGSLAVSTWNPKRILGANERINVALIGCGGRGRVLIRNLIEMGQEIACLCDINPQRLAAMAREISKSQETTPRLVNHMQKVFDDKDIDGVIIATPDSWHGLASIMACQHDKDVYVEKPHSHNIWESRKMIEAARKYKRVLQVGTQNRSAPANYAAREYIANKQLGDIRLVKVYNLKPGGPFRMGKPGTQPKGFDWDAWLGPVAYRPYHQRLFRGGWHKFWDFSGGDLANDGIHQFDLACMLMGIHSAAKAVSCSGGRLQYRGDDAEVPDVLVTTYDFDDFVMTLVMTNYPKYMRKTTSTIRRNDEFPYWTQNATRIELYGSKELMIVGRHGGGWVTMISGGKVVEKHYGRPSDQLHLQNFLDCIKSRKRANADVETLHPSLTMIHMTNIAHRLGNLKLRFDAQAERFIDNAEANKLLKRSYREKYKIPDKV